MDKSRRLLLVAALALPGSYVARGWAAPSGKPTPACDDDEPTPSQMAGPFYTPDSPAKANFRADDPAGIPVDLSVTVLDTQCMPIPGVMVDLWHADNRGRYDHDGYRLRGHQRANDQGAVRFETVMPGNYGGRTRHFHVRIFGASGGRLLTTQLYFPDEPGNAGDGLFEQELLLDARRTGATVEARFAFIVDV